LGELKYGSKNLFSRKEVGLKINELKKG